MSRIKLHDKYFVPYIKKNEIETSIKEIAERLNAKFAGCEEPPVFVTVLSGAFMFVSELIRHINFDVDMAFTSVSSYSGTERGAIRCNLDVKFDLNNRDVVILDEIIDSGKTVAYLADKYRTEGAKSVAIATMIYKTETANKSLEVEYRGIEMKDDNFIVGYGLDYDDRGRTLQNIYILDEENE